MGNDPNAVLRFRITLRDLEPAVWREIEVPSDYSFWDLHVAIQDAMGWLDYHLHAFSPTGGTDTPIGIPEHEEDTEFRAGWKISVRDYFREPGDRMRYEYDFGDGWVHDVELVEKRPREKGIAYPRCVAGARACPPEDCGGPHGYMELLEILANPRHREHRAMRDWLKGHVGHYHPFDPEAFDPAAVEFWNPGERFGIAFGKG